MVKAALARALQALGGLTGDAAGLLGRHRSLEQDRGQGLGPVHRLLDDE